MNQTQSWLPIILTCRKVDGDGLWLQNCLGCVARTNPCNHKKNKEEKEGKEEEE